MSSLKPGCEVLSLQVWFESNMWHQVSNPPIGGALYRMTEGRQKRLQRSHMTTNFGVCKWRKTEIDWRGNLPFDRSRYVPHTIYPEIVGGGTSLHLSSCPIYANYNYNMYRNINSWCIATNAAAKIKMIKILTSLDLLCTQWSLLQCSQRAACLRSKTDSDNRKLTGKKGDTQSDADLALSPS